MSRLVPTSVRTSVTWRVVAVLVVPLTVLSLWIGLTSENLQNSELGALYRTYHSSAPMVIGLFWWARRPASRMGPLLVAFGFMCWPLALVASTSPALFSIGVTMQSPTFVTMFLLILAFPSGRLRTRFEVAAFAGWYLIDVLAAGGNLLTYPGLLSLTPLGLCAAECPPNPFAMGSAREVVDLLGWVEFWYAVGAILGTLTLYLWRLARASRPLRRELITVGLTSSLFMIIVVIFYIGTLIISIPPETAAALSVLLILSRVLFPIGFLIALFQADYYALRAGGRLMRELAAGSSPERWRDSVSSAVDDPSLRLGFWEPATGRYREPSGAGLMAEPGRTWVPIERDGDPVAALSTDPALADEPELLEQVAEATLIAVVHGDLEGELRASRARLVEAGDAERRRIQRDLHDSAQQRLVALRIHLTLASERLERPEERAAIEGLGEEIDAALDDLRSVASTAYPPVLARMGVSAALRSVCRRSALPVMIIDAGLGRHPEAVENAIYFVSLEAIQNAAKHAGTAATVRVELGEDGEGVTFSIQDDGTGFEPGGAVRGQGLTNMADRLASVGGRLSIETMPGRGTRIVGRVPVVAGSVAHA
ncbi:MAG: histidine kinase [Candidatus Limnocylindrales bacterium]